jgi:hypothetical protein
MKTEKNDDNKEKYTVTGELKKIEELPKKYEKIFSDEIDKKIQLIIERVKKVFGEQLEAEIGIAYKKKYQSMPMKTLMEKIGSEYTQRMLGVLGRDVYHLSIVSDEVDEKELEKAIPCLIQCNDGSFLLYGYSAVGKREKTKVDIKEEWVKDLQFQKKCQKLEASKFSSELFKEFKQKKAHHHISSDTIKKILEHAPNEDKAAIWTQNYIRIMEIKTYKGLEQVYDNPYQLESSPTLQAAWKTTVNNSLPKTFWKYCQAPYSEEVKEKLIDWRYPDEIDKISKTDSGSLVRGNKRYWLHPLALRFLDDTKNTIAKEAQGHFFCVLQKINIDKVKNNIIVGTFTFLKNSKNEKLDHLKGTIDQCLQLNDFSVSVTLDNQEVSIEKSIDVYFFSFLTEQELKDLQKANAGYATAFEKTSKNEMAEILEPLQKILNKPLPSKDMSEVQKKYQIVTGGDKKKNKAITNSGSENNEYTPLNISFKGSINN